MSDKSHWELEGQKLRFEMLKHLSTLNTASMIALGGFTKALIDKPQNLTLLGVSFICFLISIFGTVVGMAFKAGQIADLGEASDSDKKSRSQSVFIALIGFTAGLVAAGCFLLLNL